MKINNNNHKQAYCPNFGVKFWHSESLKQIAEYAVEKNKFQKLNQARKNIELSFLTTRLLVTTGSDCNQETFVKFSTFRPKKSILIANSKEDYMLVKETVLHPNPNKKTNPLKFAMEQIIKMGNNAPHNKLFQKIIKK